MRIGLDARYLYPYFTGIGRYSYNLARALADLSDGHDYVVFKQAAFTDVIVSRARFKEVPVSARPVGLGTLTTFGFTAARERLDLLHSHFPVAPLIRPFRSVVTVHDLQAVRVSNFSGKRLLPLKLAYDLFYRFAYRATIGHADRLICPSQATVDDVVSLYHVPIERIRIVPYAIDDRFRPTAASDQLDSFRLRHNLPNQFVLYVGSSRPHKNIPGLIRGFARFLTLTDAPQARLVLAGAKERFFSDAVATINELGLGPRVIVLDYVPDDELPLLYGAARVFALISTKEGFGLPPVEAMACGVPVLASTYGSLPEVVSDAGLLVDPFNYDAIGQALSQLWNDGDLRRSLREKGLARAAQFTWREVAQRTLQVYEEVLA